MLKILFFCCFFLVSHGQSTTSITEPKLTSVIPLNSTSFRVDWQFANDSIDQSNLIVISIVIYEFYLTHNATYGPITYSFSRSNKTVTNMIFNSEWVSATYYVCFSSNSTITNTTKLVTVTNNCVLTRTCARSNTSCPGASSFQWVSSNITTNSFILALVLPIDLPYTLLSSSAQILNNGPVGSALAIAQNASFYIYRYQFNNLQSSTSYIVNTSFTYNILSMRTETSVSTITVTTSVATRKILRIDEIFLFYFVIAFLFFQIK